jgi:hypothetical protein
MPQPGSGSEQRVAAPALRWRRYPGRPRRSNPRDGRASRRVCLRASVLALGQLPPQWSRPSGLGVVSEHRPPILKGQWADRPKPRRLTPPQRSAIALRPVRERIPESSCVLKPESRTDLARRSKRKKRQHQILGKAAVAGLFRWARLGSSQRPLACEAGSFWTTRCSRRDRRGAKCVSDASSRVDDEGRLHPRPQCYSGPRTG